MTASRLVLLVTPFSPEIIRSRLVLVVRMLYKWQLEVLMTHIIVGMDASLNKRISRHVLMTASYLLSVLSSVISGWLDFRLLGLHANFMNGDISNHLKLLEWPIEAPYKWQLEALMTASYLLSVLSSVISGCLDFRLLHANYMNGGISNHLNLLECPIEGP